jgi:ABC-type sugar transport system substrate-binding protein
MFRRPLCGAALAVAVAAPVAGVLSSAPSGAASRTYTIAFAPNSGESVDVYHHAMARGGRAAAKAVGARFVFAWSPGEDLKAIFTSLIARHVDAIVTDGYDPNMTPILAKVRAAGISLLSNGDDIAGPRTLWVSYSDPEAYGEALADALASQMKGTGEYAIVGQQDQFPIADEWTRIVERYVKRTYPDMKLAGVVTGSGVGFAPEPQQREAYLAAHPHVRGLIGITPTEAQVDADAITRAHLIGKVLSAGNGGGYFDGQIQAWARSGATEFVYASDPVKLGYLGVWAAHYLVTGHRFRPGAYHVGGPIGTVWYHAAHQELRLGQPLTMTKANVDAIARNG